MCHPQALNWLVKMYGPEVNVGVSHGHALQLLCLRLGVSDVDEHGPPLFVSYVSSAVSIDNMMKSACLLSPTSTCDPMNSNHIHTSDAQPCTALNVGVCGLLVNNDAAADASGERATG